MLGSALCDNCGKTFVVNLVNLNILIAQRFFNLWPKGVESIGVNSCLN